jgi:plasmid stabilization system protein ParE
MRFRYTRRAIRDLQAIADYIRPRNPTATVSVQAAIRSSVALLVNSPAMGREQPALDARTLGITKYPYTA